MLRSCLPWALACGLLVGCSQGGGGGGGSASSAATGQTQAAATTEAPYVAVANLDNTGSPTTLLVDVSQPSGSRVVQAIGTDGQGNIVDKGTSADAETVADAVASSAAAGPSADTTTLTVPITGQTVPVLVQALK
jgi:hypothetical protein